MPVKPASHHLPDSEYTNGNLDSVEYDDPLPSASVYADDPAAAESEKLAEEAEPVKLTWKEQAAKADAEDQAFRMARAERKRAKQAAKALVVQEKEEGEEGRAAKRAKVIEDAGGEPVEVPEPVKRKAEKKEKVGSRKSKKTA